MTVRTLDTPHGPARVHLHAAQDPRAALVLGHGAGGGIGAPDLMTVTRVALEVDVSVALVEQPYRVAGRRSAPRAPILDAAWISIVEQLTADAFPGLPLITGGRSSGARVACRTAAATGAAGVLCLAFPLVAPSGTSRQEELDDVDLSVLVVQGSSDRFGMPAPSERRSVVVVRGDHGLKSDLAGVAEAVAPWLMVQLARVG
ncbi:MAG: alpha/beta hydrolase [Actinobacteria bacterium]|nr:alpha/beta hydrolase [Actinomycetota bacterium]